MKLLTFQQALRKASVYSRRHLLLGNGFSIACRPSIFVYSKLFEQADFSTLSPSAKRAFAALKTTDFEQVIKTLRDTAKLARVYRMKKAAAAMQIDSDRLKELLVQTIAASHPDRPSDISDAEYAACQAFLSNFDTVYTLNYDLLLYWTQMHHESEDKFTSDDGFRTSGDDIEAGCESDYVVWEPNQSHEQNTWFLHGALHVFDTGTEVQKFTWKRTGIRLKQQVRDALDRDFFPLFVAEGTSRQKLAKVRHSDYLAKAYRSFQSIQQCLFIFGHSLAKNDEHYLRLIERGKLAHVFIGLHGNPDSTSNKRIIRRGRLMKLRRDDRRPLRISFYDTESAKVWGRQSAPLQLHSR